MPILDDAPCSNARIARQVDDGRGDVQRAKLLDHVRLCPLAAASIAQPACDRSIRAHRAAIPLVQAAACSDSD